MKNFRLIVIASLVALGIHAAAHMPVERRSAAIELKQAFLIPSAYADSSPTPTATIVSTTTTTTTSSGVSGYIQSQGGLVAAVLSILVCINLLFSALQSICNTLKVSEPEWAQNLGNVLGKVVGWLSANVPHTTTTASGTTNPAATAGS